MPQKSANSADTVSLDNSTAASETENKEDPPIITDWIAWILLAAIPSASLLAVTSQITMEIAPIPLLWIVPMVIYLGSFILTFDSPRFYVRPLSRLLSIFYSLLFIQITMRGGIRVSAF